MPNLSLQHRFELITAPTAEPVTVTDAKKKMWIKHSDDDALIARLINVVMGFVDAPGALGKAMITQTWGEWLAPNPSVVYLSLGFHMHKVGSRTAGVDSVASVIGDCHAVELPCTGYIRSDACQPEERLRLAHYVSAG